MPRSLEGMSDCSGETRPVLLVPRFHLLNPLGQCFLSLHFLKSLVFPPLFVLICLNCLLFLGRHLFCVCKYTVMQDFSLFGTTDSGWTWITVISLSSQWRIIFFSLCAFQLKAIFWLKTRARRWTLTSLNSCWISVKGRIGAVVWVVTYIVGWLLSLVWESALCSVFPHKWTFLLGSSPLLLSGGNYYFNWISLDQSPRSTADNRSVEDVHIAGRHHAMCSCKHFLDRVKILYQLLEKSLIFK